MKKRFVISVAALLVAGLATLGLAREKGSWTGFLADANCAKNYEKAGNAGHAACAKSCLSKGAKWALAMKDGHVLLDIDSTDAEEHLGQEVTVKGELDKESNTVKVGSVSAAKQ
ncbi:MAG: hypothetical protein ACE5JI_03430 [Acidobacteriota bacterium]